MKLSLRSETLAELGADELGAVNGALPAPQTVKVECIGSLFTHYSALDCLTRYTCA